jgi:hypothetical protein
VKELEFWKTVEEVCSKDEGRVPKVENLYLAARLSVAGQVLSSRFCVTVVRRPEDLGMLSRTQLIRGWISFFEGIPFGSVITISEQREHV